MDGYILVGTFILLAICIAFTLLYIPMVLFDITALISLEIAMITAIIVISILCLSTVIFNIVKFRRRKEQKIRDNWRDKFLSLLELELSGPNFEYAKYKINKAISDMDIALLGELEYYFLDELVALDKYKVYSRDASNDVNAQFISEVKKRISIKTDKLLEKASNDLKIELNILKSTKY